MHKKLPNNTWTDEIDAVLKDLAAQGYSSGKITDILNEKFTLSRPVTRNAVVGRCARKGYQLQSTKFKNRVVQKKVATKSTYVPNQPKVVKKIEVPKEPDYEIDRPYTGIRIADLESFHCRWTDGVGHPSTFTFCGERKKTGSSYCTEHHNRVYYRAARKY